MVDDNDEAVTELANTQDAAAPADDFVRADGEIFGAHWHVFMPTLVVSILYFVGWLLLLIMGREIGRAHV